MFEIYDEKPEPPNDGCAFKMYGLCVSCFCSCLLLFVKFQVFFTNGGAVFRMYDEPESPNEGAFLRYMMNRNRQIRRQFKIHDIYDETESPNEGACLRYMMNRNRRMRGVLKIYHEELECSMMGRESPNERACLGYLMKRNRQIRGQFKIHDI